MGTVTSPRRGRTVVRLLLVVLAVVVVALVVAGWYFADQLTAPPTVRPFEPDTVVRAADQDTITLRTTADLATGGAFGLQLPSGDYASLGSFVAADGDAATYEVELYDGAVPPPGTPGRVDEFWRIGTPADIGLEHSEVDVDGPLGVLPSWWVHSDGSRGTVVFVHGRGATREESLRFLPALDRAGWDTLVITYRGDDGAPELVDGRLRWGTAEHADVGAAVDWVVDRVGPDRPIVLFGASMGGALVGQFLDRGERAGLVTGVVLDSPVLSLDATLDLQADLAGVPDVVEPLLLPTAQLVARVAYGLDSASLEQIEPDGTFDVPTLVFHGRADDFVPSGQSVAFAERRPDAVHVDVDGARHVRSWNVDRRRYETRLVDFLEELT